MNFKKIFSIVLSAAMLMTICATARFSAVEDTSAQQIAAPAFAQDDQLYAQGLTDTSSAQAWQKWSNYKGINAYGSTRYFILPSSASDNEFAIYNAFNTAVTVNNTVIPAKSYVIMPYEIGEKYVALCGTKHYNYTVYKSDSDASVYVNDTKGEYIDSNGIMYNDFYTFLTANKENAVNGSDIAIVEEGTVTDTTLKKIKGRGNTTWKTSDKKPFTLTFNSSTSIAGLESKKFSMLSNSKDGTLLRNKIVYDLADAVEQPYSPDTRFIDFYINGDYRGAFQISKKVEMGKSSLVSLKDTSDKDVTENFNFLVEIDIWNYQNDTHFTSSMGQEIVLNTPELKNYDPTNPIQKGQMDFIKRKYNEFEDALYKGDMSELEAICDIESLAKTYLINEFSKNCDGGLTSTYYTYNAEKGKFYAAPVWDFDSGLGNVDCMRAGASKSSAAYDGWLTRTITNNNSRRGSTNTLGQAFELSGTTSDGKTYEDIVVDVWKSKFIPAINYLLGKTDNAVGRLKTIDDYISSISQTAFVNYIMWEFEWGPLDYSFPNTYVGQTDYLKSWTEKRFNWINTQFKTDEQENPTTAPTKPTIPTAPTTNHSSGYYLAGNGFGGWNSTEYPMMINDDGTATIDFTFKRGTNYHFKVVEYVNGKIVNYYQQSETDEITNSYFTVTPDINKNSDFTPAQDTRIIVTFNISEGTFTAKPYELPTEPATDLQYIKGDVDLDGVVSIMDATEIQRHLAQITILSDLQMMIADLDNDEIVSIMDATEIQRIIVGISS